MSSNAPNKAPDRKPAGPSLMEGIEFSARRPIDADWSKARKRLVTGACVLLSVGAVSMGVWTAISMIPPSLPKTAQEAVAVMASARYDRLDEERKRQYASEAARLLRDMPEEQRRSMFRDEENRDALRELREQMFDDMVRKVARGEEPEMPFGPARGGPPGGPGREGRNGPPGENGPRDDANLTPEQKAEREQRQARRREEMVARMAERFQTGNAQSTGLRGEFFKVMGRQREQQRAQEQRPR